MTRQRNARILRRLQYFEATARLGSISKAAEHLGVTASAVSHQLADLKRTIGEDLFVRRGRGVALTETGELLAQRVSTAFDILDTSVTDAIGRPGVAIIQVAACSSFGPYWLIPRIAAFRKTHSGIDVGLNMYAEDPELTQAAADCIITAQPVKPGYASIDLFRESSFAVAAPGLIRDARLGSVPLITTNTDEDDFGSDWERYLAGSKQDIDLSRKRAWVRCSHYVLALEAARAGLGVALIPDFVSAGAIRRGELVDIGLGRFNHEDRVYRACVKEVRGFEPSLKAFVEWLRLAAQNEHPDDHTE